MTKLLMDKVAQAKKVISEQCVNSRWQMSAPIQADDSDIVLTDTLDMLVALLDQAIYAFDQIVYDNDGSAKSIAKSYLDKLNNLSQFYKYEQKTNYARPIFEKDPKKYSDQIDAELREVESLA